MQKLDPVVKRETLRIALGTAVLSVVMELVFVILHKWEPAVLFGNLLGAFAAVLNFFLMCRTITKCVTLEKDKAALRIRTSQMGRLLMMGAFAGAGALLPFCNTIAALVPLLFPSIVIVFLRLLDGRKNGGDNSPESAGTENTAQTASPDPDEPGGEDGDDF